MTEKLNGRFFKSQNKKHKEIIFFVHFFEGSPAALRKQIQLVNQLGYDAYGFQLPTMQEALSAPFTSDLSFGVKHIYTEEIEKNLNSIQDEKIIFSFSNPCASSIEAIVRRNCYDIKALICDSGPSFRMVKSGENLLHWNKKHSWLMTKLLNPFFSFFWSPLHHHDTPKHLAALPRNFPVLTLLCENDILIPPQDTILGFENQKHLNWQSVTFTKTGHLLAIRNHPDQYRSVVENFLNNLK